jgi:hypothetical protein
MQRRHRTPDYVRRVLEAKANTGTQPSLAAEFGTENGWSDLISMAATAKGPLHRFVDSKLELQKLYRKVINNWNANPFLRTSFPRN